MLNSGFAATPTKRNRNLGVAKTASTHKVGFEPECADQTGSAAVRSSRVLIAELGYCTVRKWYLTDSDCPVNQFARPKDSTLVPRRFSWLELTHFGTSDALLLLESYPCDEARTDPGACRSSVESRQESAGPLAGKMKKYRVSRNTPSTVLPPWGARRTAECFFVAQGG